MNVRLTETGIEFLDADAARLGVTRSDVIRAALAVWSKLPEGRRHV